MNHSRPPGEFPVVSRYEDFDVVSGSLAERLLFNHRRLVCSLCLLVTAFLALQATRLHVNASFERVIPTEHPYIVNYTRHRPDLSSSGNALRIAVETTGGTIFEANYLETLRKINDEVFLVPGVDRPFMKSLWTSSARWITVTEEGLEGGPVIPDGYDGSPESLRDVRTNVERSGEIGRLVAGNFKSSILYVPLLDRDPDSGDPLDYGRFADAIERIRTRYDSDAAVLHITGFAKIVGDLIAGIRQVVLFFAIAVVIVAFALYWSTRSIRSSLLIVACSLTAVAWLLGLLPTLGFVLDPYSILVPFLIFAIGVSHGTQKMNGIAQDIGRGTHRLVAARYTFRRLFLPGLTALLAAAAGFLVLAIIPIGAIRELAVTASLGVAVLIFTNLALLPILLSFTGVGSRAARRSVEAGTTLSAVREPWPLRDLVRFTRRRWASAAVLSTMIIGFWAWNVRRDLKIGDLNPGAPELALDSRYNRDNAFMTTNYAASSDDLVVMVETPQYQCSAYDTVAKTEELEWNLAQLSGVASTSSFAGFSKWYAVGLNEGNMKWYEVPRTQTTLNSATSAAPRDLVNYDCDLLAVHVYLDDHKADTLRRVTDRVRAFAAQNDTPDVKFLLAAGNAGFEAATNEVVQRASLQMRALVYAAVIVLAFTTFRSLPAVVCAIVPLALTSLMCEALMVVLGIGMKVATLPVVAIGVGIGVDYTLYVLAVTLARMREGMLFSEAYRAAMLFTGKVVVLAAVTLSMSVATWALSPIKFQADMGILLAFMFVWNMIGALILVPALGHFLLQAPGSRSTARPDG